MKNNNSKRLLSLIKILRKDSDYSHHLKLNELIAKLNNEGIKVTDRKTLYADLEVLKNYGYDVEYDNGYYLVDAPFTTSEIKIMVDSINSLKNLDDKFVNNLNNKLYSYLSTYDEKFIKSLEYHNRHSNKKFINRLEDALYAIKNNTSLLLSRNDQKNDEIFPLFIHRNNDYYYLYYHYPNSEKIYHTRFDNISKLNILDNKDNINITVNQIIKHINSSSNAFIKGKTEIVKIQVLNKQDYVYRKMNDDFKDITITNDGIAISINPNDIFYSKLCEYGDLIKIVSPVDVKKDFKNYLNKILKSY